MKLYVPTRSILRNAEFLHNVFGRKFLTFFEKLFNEFDSFFLTHDSHLDLKIFST